MIQVIIALLPGTVAYAWFFGPGPIVNIGLAIVFALAFEAAVLKLRAKPVMPHLTDFSAVVAAWLFALCLPMHAPWWLVALGIGFAMIAGKHLYGGLGFNPFNPAMVGYVALLISFPREMTTWYLPGAVSGQTLSLAESIAYSFGSVAPGAAVRRIWRQGLGVDRAMVVRRRHLPVDQQNHPLAYPAVAADRGDVDGADFLPDRSGGLRVTFVSPAVGRGRHRRLFHRHRSG
jgi:Na+-translocating ferredoxin:NAD+ oxidoreductase RnfD subunit